jgi:hypothetical protein
MIISTHAEAQPKKKVLTQKETQNKKKIETFSFKKLSKLKFNRFSNELSLLKHAHLDRDRTAEGCSTLTTSNNNGCRLFVHVHRIAKVFFSLSLILLLFYYINFCLSTFGS